VLIVTIYKHGSVNWMSQSDWSHFNGAEKIDSGVKIRPTGSSINHRDTSTAQPNPPVNIHGTYLKVHSDFRIDMDISDIDSSATVQFYGQIPIIYDEWRQERPSIRLEVKDGGILVRIWDGTAANSIDERIFKFGNKNKVSLGIVHSDGKFVIIANGRVLGAIPDHKIFTEGKVWFGADAKLGTQGWTLNSLKTRSVSKKPLELVSSLSLMGVINDSSSLKNLSDKNIRRLPIGAAVSVGPLATDKQYNAVVLSQFSMMTPENSFKPQFIHPQKNLYLFNDSDILVEAARKNNMTIHGHALVMGKANPEWMQRTPVGDRKQTMLDHINDVVGHYKGKVAEWDVVNEPLSEDDVDYTSSLNGLRKQMWFDAMGEEYIDIAYKAARAADPSAKLYLNDFGIEKEGIRWDALLALTKRLKERAVPIDGIGFESHVYHAPADTIDPIVLKQHIEVLASMGLMSRISEIDVLGDDPIFQAKQYADVLQACLSQLACTSYTVWGITDLYGSTTLSDRYPIVLGRSLIWDKNYTTKIAYKSLQAVLDQP
jgi:endo-1,4-beta-xylanase